MATQRLAEGSILITGGSGFIGSTLARYLLDHELSSDIVLADIARSPRVDGLADRVEFVEADLAEASRCEDLVGPDVGTVYHLASLVSGGAERDFVAGYKANLHATLNLLEACRKQGTDPRFVFTSSIATFGGSDLPDVIDDWTFQHPQNSYGVAKVIGEQLLNDYSRKGFLDGRGVRLPAIVVRDVANTAASGYASALVREPVAGDDYVCPVPPGTRLPILSIERCVELLVALAQLPAEGFGDYRTINGPGISPSAEEIAETVREYSREGYGSIAFDVDPEIEEIVQAWPKVMKAERAESLGLQGDPSIDSIVTSYIEKVEK